MVLRRKKGGGGEGKLTIKRHESLMRDQLLFMGGGRIQGRISLFSGGREGGSVVADRVKSGTVAN